VDALRGLVSRVQVTPRGIAALGGLAVVGLVMGCCMCSGLLGTIRLV